MLREIEPSRIDVHALGQMLDRTKTQVFLGKSAAFMGALICQVPIIWSVNCPTACTSGGEIYWNPYWFQKLPEKTRCTVLLHELWHIGLMHIPRMQGRDPLIWNYACDIWINNMLLKEGHSFEGWHGWSSKLYGEDMTADAIYDDLIRLQASSQSPTGAGTFNDWIIEVAGDQAWGPSPDVPFEPLEPEEGEARLEKLRIDGSQDQSPDYSPGSHGDMMVGMSEQEISRQIRMSHGTQTQISMSEGRAGRKVNLGGPHIEAEITYWLQQFLTPIVKWEEHIREFMTELHQADISYQRPNRRGIGSGSEVLLPGIGDEPRLSHLVCFTDTSGSMSDSDLLRANSEYKALKDIFNPEKMTLVQFDTRIREEIVLTEMDEYKEIRITGRGGTDFTCVRDYIEEHKPDAAIIISDMGAEMMEPPTTHTRILWGALDCPHAEVLCGRLFHIPTQKKKGFYQ